MTRLLALLSALLLTTFVHVRARGEAPNPPAVADAIDLLDAELSQWEIWMGVPHTTVTGLPEGTYQSDKVTSGQAMGLGNDPKKVFTTLEEDGQTVLRISGEIYAGLSTTASFADYHLSMQFRWGETKWEPRLDKKRDSGLLYHCYGEHGSFWKVWKSSLELQVQESDLGDFIPLAGPRAKVRGVPKDNRIYYDPTSDTLHPVKRYTHCMIEPDAPHGQWNTLELYVVGNNAVHVVNGQVVMVVQDAVDGEGAPLTQGQIQLQSEGAECYYKDLRLTPLAALPPAYAALVHD